jgi:hypothetical protein
VEPGHFCDWRRTHATLPRSANGTRVQGIAGSCERGFEHRLKWIIIGAAILPTKEDLLRELSSVPLVLKDVARAQSRLPSRGKGKPNGGDDDDDA